MAKTGQHYAAFFPKSLFILTVLLQKKCPAICGTIFLLTKNQNNK